MSLFVLIAICAAALLAVGARALAWAQRARSERLAQMLELTPNTLLSRWPIAFVSGTRTAFWRGEYWSFAPRFLAEHGFEVTAIELPWRGLALRSQALREVLNGCSQPCHLFFDSSNRELADLAAGWRHASVASITLIIARAQTRRKKRAQGTPASRAKDLRPPSTRELLVANPPRASATFAGRCARLSFALHRAVLFTRAGRSTAPQAIEIAIADESFFVERQLLVYASTLAESDVR